MHFPFTSQTTCDTLYYMKKKTYKTIKKEKKNKETKQFKEKYFEYYDDIKSHTHNVYDW